MPRIFLVLALVLLPACNFLGDESPSSDVCANVYGQYATSDVTKARCDASERGEWFEGACYCHYEGGG